MDGLGVGGAQRGTGYLAARTVISAVLIVFVCGFLLHLEQERKPGQTWGHIPAGDGHVWDTYLFPPLQLTEDSLKAFMHVIKLQDRRTEQ